MLLFSENRAISKRLKMRLASFDSLTSNHLVVLLLEIENEITSSFLIDLGFRFVAAMFFFSFEASSVVHQLRK